MWVTKKTAGSVGEHVWEKNGATVEVPDHLGHELCSLDANEFQPGKPGGSPRKG